MKISKYGDTDSVMI